MFIAMLTYTQPTEEIDKVLEAHRAYLDRHIAEGRFICAGRKNPRTGGMILMNAQDREEAQGLIAEDPFHLHQVADYELIEIIPTRYAEGFAQFLK